jgi:hypothetical protein
MVKPDSQLKSAHLLLIIVEDHEVPIDSIVLRDKVKQGDPYVTEYDIIAIFHKVNFFLLLSIVGYLRYARVAFVV